jgi:DNA gyrase/topoisomerase IV subunit A
MSSKIPVTDTEYPRINQLSGIFSHYLKNSTALEASMITPEKIEEWIREAEERPSSASLIIRFIGKRLLDLDKWNEELQTENLALRAGKKVEEYEERIATLEYQTGLLKRQLGGEVELPNQLSQVALTASATQKNVNLLIYNTQGQVLRIKKPLSDLASGDKIGQFLKDVVLEKIPLRLLAVHSHEELLFTFDSGRTVTMPVTAIPTMNPDLLDWQESFLQPPLGTEELAFIRPVARMALSEFCIQISRKGCVKKIKEALFETYIGKSYIGTGIKSPPDKTCELVFSGKSERIVLVSKEGFLICFEVDPLPTTIEEVMRLSITDHIIAAFTIPAGDPLESSLLFITQNGKIIQRHPDWLDTASSFKTRGQSIISQERREAGVKLVGAALAIDKDWGLALCNDGQLISRKIGELIGSGTVLSGKPNISLLGFTTFRVGL